jgi:hypothetical protein
MKDDSAGLLRENRVYLSEPACDLAAFRALIERTVNPADSTTATRCARRPPRPGGAGR